MPLPPVPEAPTTGEIEQQVGALDHQSTLIGQMMVTSDSVNIGGKRSGGARRKRSAQAARPSRASHGFYARQFRQGDIEDLEALEHRASVESEVAALRVALRMLIEGFSVADAPDAQTAVKLLMAVGSTATRIAGLIRTNALLQAGKDSPASASVTLAIQSLKEIMPCLNDNSDE